jgi:hypothetical protein
MTAKTTIKPRKVIGLTSKFDGTLVAWTDTGEVFEQYRANDARIDDYAYKWRPVPPLPEPEAV